MHVRIDFHKAHLSLVKIEIEGAAKEMFQLQCCPNLPITRHGASMHPGAPATNRFGSWMCPPASDARFRLWQMPALTCPRLHSRQVCLEARPKTKLLCVHWHIILGCRDNTQSPTPFLQYVRKMESFDRDLICHLVCAFFLSQAGNSWILSCGRGSSKPR